MSETAPVSGDSPVVADEQPAESTQPQRPSNPYAGTKHRVKVNGKELEIPYEKLVSDYQKGMSATERYEEASRMKKDVDALLSSIRSGDMSFLKKVVDPEAIRKFAEAELREYIEYESMSEEAKARLQAERRAQDAEERLREREEKEAQAAQAAIQEQAFKEIDDEIQAAVKEHLRQGQKVRPLFIRRMAERMAAALNSRDENAQRYSARDAAKYAQKSIRDDLSEELATAPVEEILQLLPERVLEAVRKQHLAQVAPRYGERVAQDVEERLPQAPKKAGKFKRMSTDDWFDKMQKTIEKRG